MEKTAEEGLIIYLETQNEGEEPVFLCGNFNDWRTDDPEYEMKKLAPGSYRYKFADLSDLPDPVEYKYTRGRWEYVELDEYGQGVPNRQVDPHDGTVHDFVPRWKLSDQWYPPQFLPLIQTVSDEFEIPKWIKTRRISVLLPHHYEESEKRYPVLYLQDGQNLFDDYAPFGNWAVDKRLALMAEMDMADIIIVAIDHAEEDRIVEFTPSSTTTRLQSGKGKEYVRFLADVLKPYIDQHFRTLPDRAHTGIGGSSMGGLISIYAGLMYPEVYSKLMIFSPSLWAAPRIHFHAINLNQSMDVKIYLYGGEGESENMVPNIRKFKQALRQDGSGASVTFKISIDPKGEHNEKRWGREFPPAVKWLFFEGEKSDAPSENSR